MSFETIQTKAISFIGAANIAVGAIATGVGGGVVYSSYEQEPRTLASVQTQAVMENSPKTPASAPAQLDNLSKINNEQLRKVGYAQLAAGTGFTLFGFGASAIASRRKRKEEGHER